MAEKYIPEPLSPQDLQNLSEVLEREHARISAAIESVNDLCTTRQEEVTKPRESWLRYFDDSVYDPGQGKGLYLYLDDEWLNILDKRHIDAANPHDQYMLETDALQIFAFAAYGGLSLSVETPGPDIGLAWQTINFDAGAVSVPRGIAQDTLNNTLAFANKGVYAFSVAITFEHADSNQGRLTFLRFWNVTKGIQAGETITIATGRNADATAYAITTLAEIGPGEVGDEFRLEIGGSTDSYTLVSWNTAEFVAWNVGEWREPLPSDEP